MTNQVEGYDPKEIEERYKLICKNYAFLNKFELFEDNGIVYKDDNVFINCEKPLWHAVCKRLEVEDTTYFNFKNIVGEWKWSG